MNDAELEKRSVPQTDAEFDLSNERAAICSILEERRSLEAGRQIVSVHHFGSVASYPRRGQAEFVARTAAKMQRQADQRVYRRELLSFAADPAKDKKAAPVLAEPPHWKIEEVADGYIPALYFQGGRGMPGAYGYWDARVLIESLVIPTGVVYTLYTADMLSYPVEMTFEGEAPPPKGVLGGSADNSLSVDS